jgi:O-succinylbenzoic acid--CoA ligase
MSDALSIFAAACDAPDAPGLRVAGRTCTFAELAALTAARLPALQRALVPGRPFPLVADNALATVITLYALLEMRAPVLLLHPKLVPGERDALAAAAARAVVPADAAAIIYTSGTTGTPRGAVLTRSAIVASADASASNLGWQDDDCWLLCMPIARVGGLSIVTRCLLARRCVALRQAFDAERLPAWIHEQRVTLASLVPTMLVQLLDAHPAWVPPSHLRAVLVGGAAARESLLRRAAARGVAVVLTYGLTETCSQVVATPYAGRFSPWEHGDGRVLPGAELRIDDGHIEVRGPMRMAGYLGEPALASADWLATGDLGEFDAGGCLRVHARRTDLIVTGGENVYPAEVERALESLPGIAEAGVFGLADDTWGETVAAALVAGAQAPGDAELSAFMNTTLAPHKRPRRICYVARLPHTPAGKLDRAALQALAAALRPLAR